MTAKSGLGTMNVNPKYPDGRSFAQKHPRHPAEVTSDRLGDALNRWGDRMDGLERDEISHVRDILERIAQEDGR